MPTGLVLMPDDQPNVLFLLSDQHNYRTMGHLDEQRGGEPVRTPTFDRLAESGTVFEETYCQAPLCTPSRISMLTGREVRESGGWRNGSVLPPDLQTLPGMFVEAGYETALVGKMHLAGDQQYVGFNHRPYGDLTGGAGHQFEPVFGTIDYDSINVERGAGKDTSHKVYTSRWRHAGVTSAGVTEFPESALQEQDIVDETTAFLREHEHHNPNQPWFLCASFSRPHPPYTAPERHIDEYWPDGVTEPDVTETGNHPFNEKVADWFDADDFEDEEEMRARSAYFACVSYLDEIVGDLLATLEREGMLENTIIVYTSDHGDMIGEHGLWGKRTWNEESARVPFLVELPEHRSGEVDPATITTPVSLADLFPTLCGLADVPAPDDLDGSDLSEAILTGKEPDRGPVFYDFLLPRFGDGMQYRAIRDGQYKYVGFHDAPDLLFDLDADPNEEVNLASNPTDEVKKVLERFRRLLDDTMDFETTIEEREAAKELEQEHSLSIPQGHGNVYEMPDGRLIDVDTPLFQPNVLAEDVSNVFNNKSSKK